MPELVGGGLGEEVGAVVEHLGVKEFAFDGAVDGLDVGVGVGTVRGIEFVLGVPALLDGADEAVGLEMHGVAVEFAAEVGADLDGARLNPVAHQVGAEAVGGQGGVRLGQFVAVGQEVAPDAALADGGLKPWQAVGLHLWPVDRQIGEVFGVHAEAGEGCVRGFDGPQITLGLVVAFGFSGAVVVPEDAVDRVVTEWQVELRDEAARAEARRLAPPSEDLVFERRLGFVRAVVRGATVRVQALQMVAAVTAHPLADGVAGAAEVVGGGLDPVLEGMDHEVVAQGELSIGGADHGVVR